MPIYEYQCTSCSHQFDVMQKINDAPITLCPSCSKETVTKLISAAGFQLKGTGWYVTDFKDKKKPATKDNSTSTPLSEPKDSTPKTTTSTTD